MLNATLRCNSMTLEPNFESMSFNPFSNNNNFSDSNQDPDVNFFLDNIPSLNTEYFLPSNVKIGFSKFESPDKFLVLHLNIRSLTKNFEDFKELYKTLNLKFSVVCFSVTWADDNKLEDYSSIQLPGYNVLITSDKKESQVWWDKYICIQVAVLQKETRSGHKFGGSEISWHRNFK